MSYELKTICFQFKTQNSKLKTDLKRGLTLSSSRLYIHFASHAPNSRATALTWEGECHAATYPTSERDSGLHKAFHRTSRLRAFLRADRAPLRRLVQSDHRQAHRRARKSGPAFAAQRRRNFQPGGQG